VKGHQLGKAGGRYLLIGMILEEHRAGSRLDEDRRPRVQRGRIGERPGENDAEGRGRVRTSSGKEKGAERNHAEKDGGSAEDRAAVRHAYRYSGRPSSGKGSAIPV